MNGRLKSDAAKVTLQGGLMPVAKKNQQPDLIDNRAPFFIATNDVPYFGEDDENVRRRIRVCDTKSMKDDKLIKNVDQWFMQWIALCGPQMSLMKILR